MSYMQSIPTGVLQVFQQIPTKPREALLDARDLIFEVAGGDPRIGTVEEDLRWGEPAYITSQMKSGSTIRLGIEKGSGMPAIFFNCKTSLVEEFRQQFGGLLRYSKNRAVILDNADHQQTAALKICIAAALTYHLRD